MTKDTWMVLTVITLFILSGFIYKYTFAPVAQSECMMSADGTCPTMEGHDDGHAHDEATSASGVSQVTEIGRRVDDVPPPITRKENTTVKVSLEAIAVRGKLADGVEYEYWTFDRTVPGQFIRAKEGDTVEVTIFHNPAGHSHASADFSPFNFSVSGPFTPEVAYAAGDHGSEDAHTASPTAAAGNAHADHSVDLHSVLGPGGGAMLTKVKDGETKTFTFKATRPGIYVYHCASAHIPTHIANGMYGMILVEPKAGMAKVDKEFYVMQGEFYTAGKNGEKGLQAFSKEKMDMEHPEYVVFNGRVGSLTGERALKANVGETIRIYFGVGTFLPSNFHVIGGILDKLYPEGDIISPPHRNVQTTLVPAGGAMMTEFKLEVPGTLLLVDHALPRAIDKGAVGQLVVTGEERQEIFRAGN